MMINRLIDLKHQPRAGAFFGSSSFNVGKEISYCRWATDGKP